MMQGIRTVLVVTLITLLVWALAEGQTLQRTTRSVAVSVDPGASGRSMRIAQLAGWSGAVELELQGAASAIDRVQNELREGLTLSVGAELPSETGMPVVNLRDAISQTPVFARSGVTIRRATPENLALEVQPKVEVRLPVRVRAPEGVLRNEPRVEPDTVLVKVPETVAELLPEEAVAVLAGGALDRLLPGQSATLRGIQVKLENLSPEAWGVEIVPQTVDVALRVRSRTETLTVPVIPVYVAMEPRFAGAWRVEIVGDAALNDVELSGPAEPISAVRRGEVVPLGVVRLGVDDLRPGEVSKKVELIGVPGAVLVQGAERMVKLRVSPGIAPTTVTTPQTTPQATPEG